MEENATPEIELQVLSRVQCKHSVLCCSVLYVCVAWRGVWFGLIIARSIPVGAVAAPQWLLSGGGGGGGAEGASSGRVESSRRRPARLEQLSS